MNRVDKLWAALGKAIRSGASTKQVAGIAGQLVQARGRSND